MNFGAKKRGGYYAYVTSKFANRLIVLDYDADNDGVVTQSGPDAPVIVGAVVLAAGESDDYDGDHRNHGASDDKIIGNKGFGGQGVMAVPNVYNGWVQELPTGYRAQLTRAQRNPIAPRHSCNPHDDKGNDGLGHE